MLIGVTLALVSLLIALAVVPAWAADEPDAQVPHLINYQGYITDDGGTPIDGTVEITFSVWDAATGGTQLWTETHSSVSVDEGLFNVLLGSITPMGYGGIPTGSLWLGIKVGSDPEMTPRQQITTVGFALIANEANNANTLDGKDSDEFGDGHSLDAADGSPTDAVYVDNDGNVGVGTSVPDVEFVIGTPLNTGWVIPALTVGGVNGAAVEVGDGTYNISMEATDYMGFARIRVADNSAYNGGDLFFDCGNVGIGTGTPDYKLDVQGDIAISGEGSGVVFPDGSVQTTAASSPSGTASKNPMEIALLRWYDTNQAGNQFPVGHTPRGIAFDGDHIYIGSWHESNQVWMVMKLRASDGSLVDMYCNNLPVGTLKSITFDGAHIWVATSFDNSVTKLKASDGSFVGRYRVGDSPEGMAFDGANIWVSNSADNTVTKLKASDGSLVGTYGVGGTPLRIAFDGANIWVTNFGDNTVTKLKASDGSLVGTYGVGGGPRGMAFDGANIWITNSTDNTVTKLKASDGSLMGTYGVGGSPRRMAFDGANIWISNATGDTVTRLKASDGSLIGTYAAGDGPMGIAFDGANMWVINALDDTVSKL